MRKLIIIIIILGVLYQVDYSLSQGYCGNGEIEDGSGEACDSGADLTSNTRYEEWNYEDCETDDSCDPDVFPVKEGENEPIKDCSGLGDQISGVLGCYGTNDGVSEELLCQFDVSQCDFSAFGRECVTCEECEEYPLKCSQNLCVNYCPERGSCFYDPGILEEDCKTCQYVGQCDQYTNEFDCNGDVCNLLIDHPDCRECSGQDCGKCVGGNDAGKTCSESSDCVGGICAIETPCRFVDEKDHPCLWINGRCQPNWQCSWDCSKLYGDCINGVKNKENDNCIPDDNNPPGECFDPGPNYPDKIACNLSDKTFPVFTSLGVILSIILLSFFYFIKKKRSKS